MLAIKQLSPAVPLPVDFGCLYPLLFPGAGSPESGIGKREPASALFIQNPHLRKSPPQLFCHAHLHFDGLEVVCNEHLHSTVFFLRGSQSGRVNLR